MAMPFKTTLEDEIGDFLIMPASIKDRETSEKEEKQKKRTLLITFFAMVVAGLGNQVFKKLQSVPMYNYPTFLYISTTFMYLPFSFAYIIPMIRYGSAITPEQQAVPKKIFFIMALLDGVGGIMQTMCTTYLSGALLILLMQAAIPISMVISKKLLGATYTTAQYAGAVVVATGIVVVLGPSLAGGNDQQGIMTWSAVMVLSCIPVALSTVYKERALGAAELDVIYLNGWVALYQFFLAIPQAIPAAMAGDPSVKPWQLPNNLWDGARCFAGYDSVKEGPHADHCWPWAPIFVTLYLFINIAYNIIMILLVKVGSANTLFLALTVTVPLGNLVFALPGVPGRAPVHAADLIGLVLILVGLVLYRFGPGMGGAGGANGDGGAAKLREPLLAPDGSGGLVECAEAHHESGHGGNGTGGKGGLSPVPGDDL